MAQMHDVSLPRTMRINADPTDRGRRRSPIRNTNRSSKDGSGGSADDAAGHSSGTEGPSRKRRRSRKGLDKKFECPQEGCGKSYSRAEHLYRHQLNHTPKQIYSCDFPDCARTFVRQDLCNRHRDRHNAKGSQLNRKDVMLGNVHGSPGMDAVKPASLYGSLSPEVMRPSPSGLNIRPGVPLSQYQSSPDVMHHHHPYSPTNNAKKNHSNGGSSNINSNSNSPATYSAPGTRNGADNFPFNPTTSDNFARGHETSITTSSTRPLRQAGFGTIDLKQADLTRPTPQANVGSYGLMLSGSGTQSYNSQTSSPSFVGQQTFAPFSLPPPGFPQNPNSAISTRETEPSYPSSMLTEFSNKSVPQSSAEMMILDQMSVPGTMPVFGGEGYNRSPFTIPEDFVAYLFNNQHLESASVGANQIGLHRYNSTQNHYLTPCFVNDTPLGAYLPLNQQLQHPMVVTSLLDTSLPETVLSEEKNQAIIDLIKERFNETDDAVMARQKEVLLGGDRSEETHMLSRNMMQKYIGSYWYHFSEQVPILHKPTFSPDKTPNLLLIAMMAIGASLLDQTHGYDVTQAGAELSNFLAWHLRWEIFSDYHFRPPAKLWVFQALLLLEFYEKMYSTRALHERAHIHHATTITLMRRGSSLIGRSALDSPPSLHEEKPGINGSHQSSTSAANTPDEWWNHWVTNEATRRAAFAAFIIDSTHATMFGHSTVMVAHEMRLPLPCDEALWSATNSTEVGRIEASLHAKGLKPISFLEGLKRTLNAQEVRTNSFGRKILMAGLLSVSWHMNQRDLQVNSLGVSQALGGRDKWRASLTRAFDLWKQDFDRSLGKNMDNNLGSYAYMDKKEERMVLEGRTVLHHLAHMAMHVDIVDCQIFARAKRLLGRSIGTQDLHSAQRRMRDHWAPTAKARDATWYALRFLSTVLLPAETTSVLSTGHDDPPFEYSARDDLLLNRSWVLYFAALIVWSYSFALEGPTTSPIPGTYQKEDQVRDMRAYLRRLSSVRSPEDLKNMRGLNCCTGMLMVLREAFQKTRWELLHEAANLLNNCIQLIGGGGT